MDCSKDQNDMLGFSGINIPKYLIVHHTGGTDLDPLADTSNHTFEIVNDYHKSLGWGKIGYHYFIDKKGKLTQGRLDTEIGAHTIGKNSQSLGICLAGNFDATLPTEAQRQTLGILLKKKVIEYKIASEDICPHREFATKTCYGNKLHNMWAEDLIREIQAPVFDMEISINKVKTYIEQPKKKESFFAVLLRIIINLFSK